MPIHSLDDYPSDSSPPWASLSSSRWLADAPVLAKQTTAFLLTLILLMTAYPFDSGFLPLVRLAPEGILKATDWLLFNIALFWTAYCLFSLASIFESDTLLITIPFAGCLRPKNSTTIIGGQIVSEPARNRKWYSGWQWTWHPRYFWYLAAIEAVCLTWVVAVVSDREDIRKGAVTGVILVTGYIGSGAARVMTVRWWTWY
ncbi:hypothetical protein QBC35DRAFT_451415 [Podospora australis]|uniref:Uncharacterized protein n=1 Tax=Podospora australis TaxID=1536484 RepID=A0AAN6WVG7_9PEZI|nr:hypothetical protein QBC35DRAFT_451415 [Podospora australis]